MDGAEPDIDTMIGNGPYRLNPKSSLRGEDGPNHKKSPPTP